tara:strand:- start:6477 stop:7493 length:1017 start_codon:yes stop_codon:yes gene_type:complete
MACSTCNTVNCGCTGTYVVAATCPPTCPEVFNAQCIVYTGVDILCGTDTVISRNDYLDSAITKLVNYVCLHITNEDTFGIMKITDTDSGYTWSNIGDAIAITPEDTFTVVSGVGIDVDVDTTLLAMRVTNTAFKYITFTGDSGTTSASTTTDSLQIAGGSGITTVATNDIVTVTNSSPNVDQNVYTTVVGTTGTTTASSTTDTITIDGNTGVTAAVTADTVTISVLRWAQFIADTGNTTASTVTDVLTVTGGVGITTAISGDTLTVTADVLREDKAVSYTAGATSLSVAHTVGQQYVQVRAFLGTADVTITTVFTMISATNVGITNASSNIDRLVIIG